MKKENNNEIKKYAQKLCDRLNDACEWVWHSYELIDNGFKVFDDKTLTQKYIFDFNKNIYTVYDWKNASWKKWESFYIQKGIFDFDIQVGKAYPEINKKQDGDQKFYVELIVDNYIDPETQKWMDERSSEPDYDPWDDEFDDCGYQKREVWILWAPDEKTIKKWDKDWADYEKCERGFMLEDKEHNYAWIGGIIPEKELIKKVNVK